MEHMDPTKKKFSTLPATDKTMRVVQWLEDRQASDVLALNVKAVNSLSDVVVLATARNPRHAQALADTLLKRSGEDNFEFLGMEGQRNGQWVLVDLNDVVVHILLRDTRDYMNLEGLWAKAEAVYRQQPDAPGAGVDGDDFDPDGEDEA
jgi:ribosome-associated protein